jgi:hypothetical protein
MLNIFLKNEVAFCAQGCDKLRGLTQLGVFE